MTGCTSKLVVGFAVAIACMVPAVGSDTLEPAGATAERHERALTDGFSGLFEFDVVARAIVERTNTPQFATGIDQTGDVYRIFSIEAANPEWTAIEDRKPTAGRCELAITSELAQAIVGVWKAMLLGARNQLDTPDVDGSVYYFSMAIDGELHMGQTTDPLPSSAPGQLVSLVVAMREACHTKGAAGLSRLPGLVASIRSGLGPASQER